MQTMNKKSPVLVLKPELSTVEEVQTLSRKLMNDHGLTDWNLQLGNGGKFLGQCHAGKKRITLQSKHVLENLGKLGDNLIDTILHEIAHALNYVHRTGRNHDRAWKNWCEKVGATPYPCEQKAKYRIVTDTEEVVGEYHHLPPFANDIGTAMLEGRQDTYGTLSFQVLENDQYIPAAKAERSVLLKQCKIEKAVMVAPDNSSSEIIIPDDVKETWLEMLFSGFKHDQFYRFNNEERASSNSLHGVAKNIFQECIDKNMASAGEIWAAKLAKYGTDVYSVKLSGCIVGTRYVDALGLFGITKEEKLTAVAEENGIRLVNQPVIRVISGCLIFADEENEGYLVSVFDHTKRNNVPSGLELAPDTRNLTKYILSSVQQFVRTILPEEEDNTKEKELHILEEACEYVNNTPSFNLGQFASTVAPDPETAVKLKDFLEANGPPDALEQFDISKPTAIRETRHVKKMIRLDNNFSIQVLGDPHLLQKLFDPDTNKNFYKIYFNEEK